MRNSETNRSGFTLIELLIAIAIFATVTSSVYGAYRVSFHNISITKSRLEYSLIAQRAFHCISNDLLYMVNNDNANLVAKFNPDVANRGFTLDLVTSNQVAFNPDTLQTASQRVTYSTEYDDKTKQISLYRSFIDSKLNTEEYKKEKWLVANKLVDVRFAFYDVTGNERNQWLPVTEDDEQSNKHPNLIRVEFFFPTHDEISEHFRLSTAVALSDEVQK